MGQSFPLAVCFVQFLLPCRSVHGACEVLLKKIDVKSGGGFHILAISPNNSLWETIEEQETAHYRILRGLVTETLKSTFGESTHRMIGVTEPFLYTPAKKQEGNGHPHIGAGYVFNFEPAAPPQNFQWVSFAELLRGRDSAMKVIAPSEDPMPFNNMVADATQMFTKQVC